MPRFEDPLISLQTPGRAQQKSRLPQADLDEWSATIEKFMCSTSMDTESPKANPSESAVQICRGVSIATVQWAAAHLPLPPAVRILECAASHLLNAVTADLENTGSLQSTSYTHFTDLGHSSRATIDLQATSDFIERAITKRSDSSVLIICPSGVNRAASVAAAYLLTYGDKNATLLSVIRRFRQLIGPCLVNPAQQRQLVQYAAQTGKLGSPADLNELRAEIERRERELERKLFSGYETFPNLLQEDDADETSSGSIDQKDIDLLA